MAQPKRGELRRVEAAASSEADHDVDLLGLRQLDTPIDRGKRQLLLDPVEHDACVALPLQRPERGLDPRLSEDRGVGAHQDPPSDPRRNGCQRGKRAAPEERLPRLADDAVHAQAGRLSRSRVRSACKVSQTESATGTPPARRRSRSARMRSPGTRTRVNPSWGGVARSSRR